MIEKAKIFEVNKIMKHLRIKENKRKSLEKKPPLFGRCSSLSFCCEVLLLLFLLFSFYFISRLYVFGFCVCVRKVKIALCFVC